MPPYAQYVPHIQVIGPHIRPQAHICAPRGATRPIVRMCGLGGVYVGPYPHEVPICRTRGQWVGPSPTFGENSQRTCTPALLEYTYAASSLRRCTLIKRYVAVATYSNSPFGVGPTLRGLVSLRLVHPLCPSPHRWAPPLVAGG